jgi:hypothetical protein
MRNRFFKSLGAVALVMAAILCSYSCRADTAGRGANPKTVWGPDRALRAVDAPRTPWGDPDIQGFGWCSATRPGTASGAGGEVALHTDEAIAAFKKAVALDAEVDPTTVHYDWKDTGWTPGKPRPPNRRTSLIVDPPDGRIPRRRRRRRSGERKGAAA